MQPLLIQISHYIRDSVEAKYATVLELTPFILGALSVLLFGFILGELTAKAILELGHKLKLEFISEKIGLKHFLLRAKSTLSPSELIAQGVKGYIIFLFFIEATKIAKLNTVADFSEKIIGFIPEIIVAVFIMLIGFRLGNTLFALIQTSMSFAQSSTATILAMAVKAMIFAFTILAALAQLSIAGNLVQILFIGLVAMIVVAGGLAFGLGGKDVVHDFLHSLQHSESISEHHDETHDDNHVK
jgi:hypothetical protein